jgi:hypothetical protein
MSQIAAILQCEWGHGDPFRAPLSQRTGQDVMGMMGGSLGLGGQLEAKSACDPGGRSCARLRSAGRSAGRSSVDGRTGGECDSTATVASHSQPIDVSFRPFPLHARPAPASVAVALVASTVPAALSPITVTEIEGVATRIPAVAFVVPPFSSRIRIVHGKVPS